MGAEMVAELVASVARLSTIRYPTAGRTHLWKADWPVLGVATLCLAAVAAVRWRRLPADSSRFSLLFAFLVATGVVFISSSIAVYDQFLLVPGLLILWRDRSSAGSSRTLRFATLVLAAAFCWPWSLLRPYFAHLISPSWFRPGYDPPADHRRLFSFIAAHRAQHAGFQTASRDRFLRRFAGLRLTPAFGSASAARNCFRFLTGRFFRADLASAR